MNHRNIHLPNPQEAAAQTASSPPGPAKAESAEIDNRVQARISHGRCGADQMRANPKFALIALIALTRALNTLAQI